MKRLGLAGIRFYQRVLGGRKGLLRWLLPSQNQCRFSPTCSEYAYEAIFRYGIIKGSWMGVKRILRCGPWTTGGIDPVPKQKT